MDPLAIPLQINTNIISEYYNQKGGGGRGMDKLASDFLKMNMYLNLEICVVCSEFLAFKNVLIVILETNLMIIYFYT